MVITTRMRSYLLWSGIWLLVPDIVFFLVCAVQLGLYLKDEHDEDDMLIFLICFVALFGYCLLIDVIMIIGVARLHTTPPAVANAQYITPLILTWIIGTGIRCLCVLTLAILGFILVPNIFFIIIGVFIILSIIIMVFLMYVGVQFYQRVTKQKARGDSEVDPNVGPSKYAIPDNAVIVVVDSGPP